jgi:hypothetical protein
MPGIWTSLIRLVSGGGSAAAGLACKLSSPGGAFQTVLWHNGV